MPSPILPVRAAVVKVLHHFLLARIGDDQLDLDFGQQVDLVFHAAVDLLVALLAAVAADLGDGHAVDADGLQSFFDVFEFVGLNNGFDFLHGIPPLRE